jgi:hypothetical protein
MPWQNGPLTLYHGRDGISANNIMTPTSPYRHSITLVYCRALADFGRGFYTTTNLHQARNWANDRCNRLQFVQPPRQPTVLRFDVDRNHMALLQTLCFVTEGLTPPNTDYWNLITYCRQGQGAHRLSGNNYDVVYGPVSLWPQTLVIKDCDQISFHTDASLMVLPTPSIQP